MFENREDLLSCTGEALDELDFKISIALSSCEKWTDNLYSVIQYIQQRSCNDISFADINSAFPYVKNVDCSLMLED